MVPIPDVVYQTKVVVVVIAHLACCTTSDGRELVGWSEEERGGNRFRGWLQV